MFVLWTQHCSYFIYLFSELAILQDNKDLKKSLSEFQMPTMKHGTLKIGGFGEKCMLKNLSQKLLKIMEILCFVFECMSNVLFFTWAHTMVLSNSNIFSINNGELQLRLYCLFNDCKSVSISAIICADQMFCNDVLVCETSFSIFFPVFLPTDLWYQMMLPPNFKNSKKYPLLIDVWVSNIPNCMWHH